MGGALVSVLPNRVVVGVIAAVPFWGLSARAQVATMALRAVAINGSPIEATGVIAVSPGDTVEVEIHIWGFGKEFPEGIRWFSAGVLNRAGAVSGNNGTILPLGWDAPLDQLFCNTNEAGVCPDGMACVESGVCRGDDHFPAIGARVDPNRTDYLLFGFETIELTQVAELDYTYAGLITTNAELRVDDGGIWYGGSLSLVVSEAACGTFTFFLSRCSGRTLLAASSFVEIVPHLLPLQIETGPCPLLPTATSPENCVVDARRAFAPDASNDPLGWDKVSFQFDRNPSATSLGDFVVTVAPDGDAPAIVDIDQIGAVTLVLTLERPISPEHWTCVKHLPSSRVACFGSLPVDVDQSLLSVQEDIEALVVNLNTGNTQPDFRCDLDRSSRCGPLDILEAIDLLNGADSVAWQEAAIESSCPSDSSAIFRDPDTDDRGACCNPKSGFCMARVTFADCTDDGGSWLLAAPCCAAACTASLGSCCNESTGSCRDGVAFGSCGGASETWAAETSCDAVECGLPRGACCNSLLGVCANDVLQSQCQRNRETWVQGATCAQILCAPR